MVRIEVHRQERIPAGVGANIDPADAFLSQQIRRVPSLDGLQLFECCHAHSQDCLLPQLDSKLTEHVVNVIGKRERPIRGAGKQQADDLVGATFQNRGSRIAGVAETCV